MSGTKLPFKVTTVIEDTIIKYCTRYQELLMVNFNMRGVLTDIDRAYMREKDWTQDQLVARTLNKAGDIAAMQNVTVPIVMPQVESAVDYYIDVFLSGYPIFAVNSAPDTEAQGKQYEAIIAENSDTANWKRQLIMFFRDGLKYNLHALEVDWCNWTLPGIETDVTFPNSAKPKQTAWAGNSLKRIDLYNAFWDPRVAPADIYKDGEYAGYNEFYSRTKLKQFLNNISSTIPAYAITRALESTFSGSPTNSAGYAPFSYYTPVLNPDPLIRPDQINSANFNWWSWATENSKSGLTDGFNYGLGYIVTTMYARIIPSDFGIQVPQPNTPQVWKFIIVNGKVVVLAERQSNVHGYIPILFGQPIEDGLGYQTKSFATNVTDMQSIATAMWTAWLASKRRLVGDRVIYDPMRIREKDINSTNPSAKIPVRPSAMGTRVADAVYQFPFHDEATESLVQGSTLITNFANLVNGQNPAQQGQFVKGNKTQSEYDDVMGHGNGRNMAMAIMTETQVFVPAKHILMLNIMQYQPAGNLNSPQPGQPSVQVDPDTLRQQVVAFKVSDGLTPTDKLMSTDDWTTAMQVIGSSPGIGNAYDMAGLFTYIMQQREVDLTPFQKSQAQLQYEQQLQAWQQAAAMAAQKGAAFNTPMPQSPAQQAAAQQQAAQGAQSGGGVPNGLQQPGQAPTSGAQQFGVGPGQGAP